MTKQYFFEKLRTLRRYTLQYFTIFVLVFLFALSCFCVFQELEVAKLMDRPTRVNILIFLRANATDGRQRIDGCPHTRWCPLLLSWFIIPSNYSYLRIINPNVIEVMFTNLATTMGSPSRDRQRFFKPILNGVAVVSERTVGVAVALEPPTIPKSSPVVVVVGISRSTTFK